MMVRFFKCAVLNFLKEYFELNFGKSNKWIESDEKYESISRNGTIQVPVRIDAEWKGYKYEIILTEQEFYNYMDNTFC